MEPREEPGRPGGLGTGTRATGPYGTFSAVIVLEMGLPMKAKKEVPGLLGGEPGRGYVDLFRRVLALLGSPCPPGALYINLVFLTMTQRRNCDIKSHYEPPRTFQGPRISVIQRYANSVASIYDLPKAVEFF